MLDFNLLYERAIYKNLKRHKKGRIARRFSTFWGFVLRFVFNCDINLGVTLGENVKIPHAVGIVIGGTAVIENGVVIMPNVVIGAKQYPPLSYDEKRHATIRKNVLLGANATIIGNITIGENAVVAAGAVVTKDVPPYATVIGNNILVENKNVQT